MRLLKLKNSRYGLFILLISVILTIAFLFSRANNFLTEQYFNAFFPITIGVTIMFFLINLMEQNGGLSKPFFFNEARPSPIGNNTPLKLSIGIMLAAVFSIGAIGLGSAIIDLPQPFQQQAFSQVTDYDKIYYQAVIPAFFEEGAIFVITSAVSFLTLSIMRVRKASSILMSYLIAAGVGAAILTQAHRFVYGSDVGAFLGIFIFEFVVQFFNLFTGMFVSWIPHLIHNGVVSLNFLVAFSVGGVAFLVPVIARWKNAKVDV